MHEVLYLVHVPKCAGRTVERFGEAAYPPGAFVRPLKAAPMTRYLTGRGWRRPADLQPDAVRAVSGHFFGRDFGAELPAHIRKEAILLRDPVALFLSWYNYRMTRFRRVGRSIPTLEAWFEMQGRNVVARHLFTRHLNWPTPKFLAASQAELADRATEVLDDFWFVAGHTHVGDILGAISERLALPPAMQHHNKTDYMFRTLETLPTTFVERVYRENAVDRYLFERYGERRFDVGAARPAERPMERSGHLGAEARRAFFYARESVPGMRTPRIA